MPPRREQRPTDGQRVNHSDFRKLRARLSPTAGAERSEATTGRPFRDQEHIQFNRSGAFVSALLSPFCANDLRTRSHICLAEQQLLWHWTSGSSGNQGHPSPAEANRRCLHRRLREERMMKPSQRASRSKGSGAK
ncbi:hypothetical protein EYF80_056694 [Liparis tanakae]|uniref:Uncharacterized protein n=1 Tax=Liparis tanakae TaxID=230148 RepID=A0A4Z2EY28_9TELE|nr:hypothetical protein EYF80_056694 [Liparis tanakae]